MPNDRARRLDVNVQIDRLQRRHSELSARVAELDGRMHLSSDEQVRINALKKQKLATKDELMALRAQR